MMSMIPFVAAIALVLALIPIIASACRSRRRTIQVCTLLALITIPAALLLSRAQADVLEAKDLAASNRPIEAPMDGYVQSSTCRSCHPQEYATWKSSYHSTMTQLPNESSVLGDFNNRKLEHDDTSYTLEESDGSFWVISEKEDATGEAQRKESQIELLTGSHNNQAYWISADKGRNLDLFSFYWDIHEETWMPVESFFLSPPGRTAVPTGKAQWNVTCQQCHVTRGNPGRGESRTMDTTVAEFGIACEACHGPAEQHVKVNRNPLRRFDYHLEEKNDDTIIMPTKLDHVRSSQVCAQCHSTQSFDLEAWLTSGFEYQPGDDLTESRVVESNDTIARNLKKSFFWRDGMGRVSGREYNNMSTSACYIEGELSCFSCHIMHKTADDTRALHEWQDDQLKPKMRTNASCLQCHAEYAEDLTAHTRHAPESSGSECLNCHMSYTVYGLKKALRSHKIEIPTVEASLRTGRPNACNQCHLDKSLGWAADSLSEWTGEPSPSLTQDQKTIAASVLWTMTGEAGQRALMGWSFGWKPAQEASGSDWMAPYLAVLLEDPYHTVRFIAQRSLRSLPGFADFEFDFMAAESERAQATQGALQTWREQYQGGDRSELLSGAPERDKREQARLRKSRDNRPIYLAE
jgi:hypothetical protein